MKKNLLYFIISIALCCLVCVPNPAYCISIEENYIPSFL
nr:MAG TPA: hypothetical protein [Caudoviricetes sp.]